ncbi:hypothetical protein XH88_33975 [Bradyrhizobium sp. CCBAU 51627]|nr:hypothetical protein [Bradyrhizobium sp. CCBAU 51627]
MRVAVMMMIGMIAMLVVMVIMIMVMMAMIVVTMMRMIVVRLRMASISVSATLGIERRLDLDHARAKPLHHRLDDVVAANAQGFGHELRRQMAVAEVPGHADQMMRVAAADLQQRLGRRDHLDQPSVFQHERVSTAQRDRVLEV